MKEWIEIGLLFLAVSGLVWALLAVALRRWQHMEERPDPNAEPEPEPERPVVTGPAATGLSEQSPGSRRGGLDLHKDLRLAGYYRPTALLDYRAVRTALVLVPLIVAGVLAVLSEGPDVNRVLLYGGIAALLGYSLPRLYLTIRARSRARQIGRGLPLAIDLLTLCLSAGQNLLAALQQVSRELSYSHPVLAQELSIAYQQAQLHSLEQAMKQWAARVSTPEVTNLALVLIQSERLGTDAALTLQEMAHNLRTNARQRAEAQANRTSFWMLFPTIFCFWIAAAIILIGPPYFDFFQQRRKSADTFIQIRNNINRANQPGRRGRAPANPPAAPEAAER